MVTIGNAIITDLDTQWIPLASTHTGKLFRKQVLPLGPFSHPKDPKIKIKVTPEMCAQIVSNFDSGYCDIVQVPLVNDSNQHSENPLDNIGRVVGVDYVNGKGLYATVDARKHAEDVGKTLLGASAYLHLNYTDTRTGNKVGPTLLHLAVTNRPHITNLEPFQEVLAASAGPGADTTGDALTTLALSAASEEEDRMTLDELLTVLKAEHGIDVEALQASAAGDDEGETITDEMREALLQVLASAGVVSSDDSEITITDVAEGVVELSREKIALSERLEALENTNEALELAAVEFEVDGLIKATRILPAQREPMIELALSNRDMFDQIVPATSLVQLSAVGTDVFETPRSEQLEKDIDRLAALANGESK